MYVYNFHFIWHLYFNYLCVVLKPSQTTLSLTYGQMGHILPYNNKIQKEAVFDQILAKSSIQMI